MTDEVKDAAERIRLAVDGKPKGHVKVKVGVDAEGEDVFRDALPLVEVVAGDVLALCESIPAEARTQVVKDLRKGTRAVAPERKVHCQAACLWKLLAAVGG